MVGIREYSRHRPEWRLIWAPDIGWVRRLRLRGRRAGIIARIRLFSAIFKAAIGQSPGAYRAAAKPVARR